MKRKPYYKIILKEHETLHFKWLKKDFHHSTRNIQHLAKLARYYNRARFGRS